MYYHYIDHPHYGRIWYEMTLRNWWVLGHTEQQNLDMGPCIELVARDYAVIGGGKTIESAITHLWKLLDWHQDDGVSLPANVKPYYSSLRSRWKWWRAKRRWRLEGKLCRITKDTGR